MYIVKLFSTRKGNFYFTLICFPFLLFFPSSYNISLSVFLLLLYNIFLFFATKDKLLKEKYLFCQHPKHNENIKRKQKICVYANMRIWEGVRKKEGIAKKNIMFKESTQYAVHFLILFIINIFLLFDLFEGTHFHSGMGQKQAKSRKEWCSVLRLRYEIDSQHNAHTRERELFSRL